MCNWLKIPNGYQCQDCNTIRMIPVGRDCPAQPNAITEDRSVASCPHLGIPLPEDFIELVIVCTSCNGKAKTINYKSQIHCCGLHGRCDPNYQCSKDAISEQLISGTPAEICRICPEYPPNKKSQETTLQ